MNTWTVYCNDSAGNLNYTNVSFFKDTIFPSISIVTPVNNSNFSTARIDVNYTVSDANLFNCWYTNSSGRFNASLANCGTNLTFTWLEGKNNITVYSNYTV